MPTTASDARADELGVRAKSPSQIPAPGWKNILMRVFAEISNDRVLLVAAGVTYYLLLAMVPAMASLVSIYGLVADPATVGQHIGALSTLLPGGAMQIVDDQLTRLAGAANGTLGLSLIISLAISLWSANAGVKALFEAMNVAYDEKEERSFIRLTLVSLVFTLCLLAAALTLIALTVVLPIVLGYVGLGQGTEWLITAGSIAATLIFVSLVISALYRWGPCRRQAKWRWITPGSVLAVLVIAIVSLLFSWYTANFGSYDATYGSLGALIGMMTWMWLTMIILIVGGELNSEMEHQTARDTTTGREKPMGTRGATMADQVADATVAGGRLFMETDPSLKREIDALYSGAGERQKGREERDQWIAAAVPAAIALIAVAGMSSFGRSRRPAR
ncbi:YihY/virulence factor BrkB family protein [Jiella endophytica]|uniref:YihY/virulence factor BrkB family protein n=1 Tax=Jiella endophytica TaxID=2558362 RepID=A0A4Y8RPB9_9HYPH|nr:YihY/virulence factor BrkB family protein [Jiella endophytica]TFF25196.1 YihY/virulence factor BrkB family protein [Jiella endophytica]